MKKTLIAVAALAATSAFAQVTITGTMDATYRMTSIDRANGTSLSQSVLGKDGIGTTGVTFSGNEDLGGGLKAVFLYEHNFDLSNTGGSEVTLTETQLAALTNSTDGPISAAVADGQTNGQMFVGLEGAFGSIKLGAPNTPTLTIQGARGAGFGTKDGGRVTGLLGTSLTRWDSSFLYTSPNFSGFSFALNYVPENEAFVSVNAADVKVVTGAQSDIGLFYANGPIAGGVTMFSRGEIKADGAVDTGEFDQTNFYVSYNFGFAKFTVGGHNQDQKNTAGASSAKESGWNVAADVPLSPALTLTANIQSLDDKVGTGTADNDKSAFGVGLQYSMSKRTMAYVRYVDISTDNLAASSTATKDSSTFLAGLRHNF